MPCLASLDELITAMTPAEELDEIFDGTSATLLAGGHTHVPLTRRHSRRLLVNPGSVGMPFAEYGHAGGVEVLDHATDVFRIELQCLLQLTQYANKIDHQPTRLRMPSLST